jgi:hypothetical protein
MNEPEHVFPLPDVEKHKLEQVEEGILHPVANRWRHSSKANRWGTIALSLVTGVLCGWVLGRRS